MYKKNDVEVACNMIKSNRKYSKKFRLSKSISMSLFKQDNYFIYADLGIVFNKNTGCISFAHSLRHKKTKIYPTTNKKLVCINSHALNVLNKSRERNKKSKVEKTLSTKLFKVDNHIISSVLNIKYHKKSQNVSFTHYLNYYNNKIIVK